MSNLNNEIPIKKERSEKQKLNDEKLKDRFLSYHKLKRENKEVGTESDTEKAILDINECIDFPTHPKRKYVKKMKFPSVKGMVEAIEQHI